MIAANAPPQVIKAARRNFGGQNSDDCEVWEENWEPTLLFLAVGTQWIISPVGGYVGINYVALESAMNMAGIKKKKRTLLFDDVRIMESAALEVLRNKN